MSYKALILLSPASDASIEEAKKKLENLFADDERDVSIESDKNEIRVSVEGWNARVHLNADDYVVEESEEMANNFAAHLPEKEEIARSPRRFEVACDEDEEMSFFNDYLSIIQELGDFEGAKIWEQAQQEFI
jgi:hypothetical protein